MEDKLVFILTGERPYPGHKIKTWEFYFCSPHHQALAAIVKDKQRS